MEVVLSMNPRLSDHDKKLLLVSAFLHDAGNSPFAHLGERIMKPLIDRDGETFLFDVLEQDPEAKQILERFGLSVFEILLTVTGKTGLSCVLHGSVDVDNLDNVRRYAHHAQIPIPDYDPLLLAQMYVWKDGGWHIHDMFVDGVLEWMEARRRVYNQLYHTDVVAPDFMITRALKSAVEAGTLTREFFFLTDHQALEWLSDDANTSDAWLVREAMLLRWFKPVYTLQTDRPSLQLRKLGDSHQGRWTLAQELVERTGIAPNLMGVHVGRGRDTRQISLPVIDHRGLVRRKFPNVQALPIYRARAFLHDRVPLELRKRIASLMEEIIDLPSDQSLV